MNSYNRQIANRLLHDELKMINNTSQPEMLYNELDGLKELHDGILLGGGRPLKYIQSGNNIQSSEPRTLTVGRDPFENVPMHLVETGGNIRNRRGRPSKAEGGNIFDTLGSVAKTAAPFAPLLMMAAGLEKKKRGRPKKGGSFLSSLGSVAKSLAPVAQQVVVPVATQMLQNYMTKGASSGAGLKKRGRPKKGGSFLSGLGSVAKSLAPVAQQIAVPVATQMLQNYMTKGASSGAGLRKRKTTKKGGDIFNDLSLLGMGLPAKVKRTRNKGGSCLSGLGSVIKSGSFLSGLGSVAKSLAPIAQQVAVPVAQQMLTNYMTKGASSGSGAGLKNTSKRGQLIKQVMAQNGCSLGEASKYIKAHQLN